MMTTRILTTLLLLLIPAVAAPQVFVDEMTAASKVTTPSVFVTPGALPGACTVGEVRFDNSDAMLKVCIATNTWASSASTAPLSVGALDGQAANSSGLTIAASTLYAQSADATHPGLVNTTSQTFAGAKTFSGGVIGNVTGAVTGNASTATALAANPADCSAGQFATTIAANGDLTCSQITSTGTITSGIWNGTAVDVAHGGTGRSSLTANALIVGNGTSAVTLTSATAFGQMLAADSGGVPVWTGHPHLGDNSTYTGALDFSGSTSGTITIQPQAAAGTYNFNLPTSAGTSGKPLLSGGGGSSPMTFGTLGVAGGGTGATSLTANALLLGNGTSAFQVVTPQSTQGYALQTDGSGLPIFDTTLTLGKSSVATGQLDLAGLTSGTVSIKSQDAAGTYNFNLPTTAGLAGQVLASQGGGSSAMIWMSSLTNPMTTANDIIFGGSAGAAARSVFVPPYIRTITSGSGTFYYDYVFLVSGISTAPTAGATYTNNGITFTVDQIINSDTLLYANGSGAPAASGTLTKASGTGDSTITFASYRIPISLRVRLIGGGGGGAGGGNNGTAGGGVNGNNTTFGTLTAGGGAGGAVGGYGAGGSASIGSGWVGSVAQGQAGRGFTASSDAGEYGTGGAGGGSYFGMGGAGSANAGGNNPSANSGGGGGGGGFSATAVLRYSGSGGGGGGFVDAVTRSAPSAAGYSYSVAALGSCAGGAGCGGAAGTNGYAGAAGATGYVEIWQAYQ